MTEQLTDGLKPIVCVYCTKFITFIEFDMEQHLFEDHYLFSRYCNNNSPTMDRAIADGKRLGLEVSPVLLRQLNKDFLTHQITRTIKTDVRADWIPAPTSQEVIQRLQGMKSWSDNNETFTPIVSIEKFFREDISLPLCSHSLEKSPCYPVIDFKDAGKHILYSCSLHPNLENVNLESLEHHCRYANGHKEEIIARVSQSVSRSCSYRKKR